MATDDAANVVSSDNISVHEDRGSSILIVPAPSIHRPCYYHDLLQARSEAVYSVSRKVSVLSIEDQLIQKKKFKLDGIIEMTFNAVGTALFVVGSFGWVVNMPTVGSIIFAVACGFCAIANSIFAHKFRMANDDVACFALAIQAIGSFTFVISSIAFIFSDSRLQMFALIGFFFASCCYLFGCILTQVLTKSLRGPRAPIFPVPTLYRFLWTSLLNTVGAVQFTVGSALLFFPPQSLQGAWWYGIGSIAFFLASWGDFCLWVVFSVQKSTKLDDPFDPFASVKFGAN